MNLKPLCAFVASLFACSAHADMGRPDHTAAPSDSAKSVQLKIEALKTLEDLRAANAKRLKEIDASVSQSVEYADDNMVDEIATLKSDRQEHQLRQEFLDRLINKIDLHFHGEDLRAFLGPALKEMAKTDALNSEGGLYVFLRRASEGLEKMPDTRESALAFLEGYMNQSVAHPQPIKDFLAARNYTDGIHHESGHPVPRDQVGAIVEERLRSDAKPIGEVAPLR